MLEPRSMLAGGIAGFTAALLVTGFVGCQKKDDDKTPAANVAPTATGQPAQSPEDLNAPLATVDGVVITVQEFQEQLNRQSPYVRARYTSKEEKKNFLDTLVTIEVMAKEAERRGLDKDPEVVRTMKQVMIQKLSKDVFSAEATRDSITEAELQDYYKKHEAEYRRPAQVRAAAIVVKDKALADKLAKEAKDSESKSHSVFRDMVIKSSVDEVSKQNGGDLGYFDKESTSVPKPVIEAAFATENGKVSGVIAAGDGRFFIVKVTGTRPAMEKSFEDVKSQIQTRVLRDKQVAAQKEFVESLKSKAKVEINEANLDKVQIEPGKAEEPGHGALPDLRNLRAPMPSAPPK
ncbi:MAG TPA: peptidyl-prolyl cis-trans isomerase [Haliangium sp.]|nr:peptidyl-prolyl cis-trans isomerase [Haliangium sp.]